MLKRRPKTAPDPSKFWSLVDKSSPPCWLWKGPGSAAGYGYFGHYGVAHRVAYELVIGPIPPKLELDHLCRNRGCVNPEHLEAVSHRENLLRGQTISARNAAKTHCIRGHPFNLENTLVSSTGGRTCRTCAGMAVGRWEDRNRDKVLLGCRERAARSKARRIALAAGEAVPEWAVKRCEPWAKVMATPERIAASGRRTVLQPSRGLPWKPKKKWRHRSRDERKAIMARWAAPKTPPAV